MSALVTEILKANKAAAAAAQLPTQRRRKRCAMHEEHRRQLSAAYQRLKEFAEQLFEENRRLKAALNGEAVTEDPYAIQPKCH